MKLKGNRVSFECKVEWNKHSRFYVIKDECTITYTTRSVTVFYSIEIITHAVYLKPSKKGYILFYDENTIPTFRLL